ncbi:MAG: alpha/beta hydrolase [Hydrogenophaga sp.]|jgi:acetyl esterase/lipase|nr:alpha/beta hydrolase [Hydrogenophaga sp.]
MNPGSTPPRRGLLATLGLLPLLQACSPLRVINTLVPTGTHRVVADQAYGPDQRQRLDVYQPDPTVAGAPIVVFFYGGSWSNGRREDYRFVGEALASRGIVTLVADYRLSPQVRYPVFVQDSALALRWAADRATDLGASPQRLHVMGHSAGAYNAAMLALDPRWLAGVSMRPERLAGWVGLAGPYDFLPIEVRAVQTAFEWPATPADSQPLFHAQRKGSERVPPALLLAARRDVLVDPLRNSQALANALTQQGAAVDFELLGGVSHTTLIGAMAAPLRGLAPVLDRVSGFLNRPVG